MAVNERRRSHLYDQLVHAVGEEAATIMFELLPPAGTALATRADLNALDERMQHGFAMMDERFAQIDERMQHGFAMMADRFARVDERFAELDARMDERFARVDERFTEVDTRMDTRIDAAKHETMAAFRGEIVAAVSGQTRAIITAVLTTILGILGLAVAAGQLL
jgi:predicted SAM-dependent methyltransferase